MGGLFDEGRTKRPLAERMRPRSLEETAGLEGLLGPGAWLSVALQKDRLPSMIFYGPPGTGKTTLARLLAQTSKAAFESVNAVTTGVQELRGILEAARKRLNIEGRRTILFLDEIHRLNRGQQEVLLPFVEDGSVVLIGATTQNPFFDVSGALLSRVRTISFKPLPEEALEAVLTRALRDRERGLGELGLTLSPQALAEIQRLSGGDARVALSLLEEAALLGETTGGVIDRPSVVNVAQGPSGAYDRSGDEHYHTISAFIKSIRGSDADSAMVWLAKMLLMGDDVRFIARRLVILAAEDIGLADPRALQVAVAAAQATELVGRPECEYPLAEATLYLALAPKSNSATTALAQAKEVVQDAARMSVPAHLRNLTGRANSEADAPDYKYPHDFPGHFVAQDYWPLDVPRQEVYRPGTEGEEPGIRERDAGRKKPGK